MKVFKFGGASVRDVRNIKNIGSILEKFKEEKLIIVFSAMGKTTNHLECIVSDYFSNSKDLQNKIDEFRQNHEDIAHSLTGEDPVPLMAINEFVTQIEWITQEKYNEEQYDYVYDQIVSIGELLSSSIISAYLKTLNPKSRWFDVRDVMVSDNTFRNAKIDWSETEIKMNERLSNFAEDWIVTQGFIASNSNNETTTLGREGSDFSASIISYCLNAESMTIWKDVPGILTADPRIFDHVQKIDNLSYYESIMLTYYGAQVIHPKSIKPIEAKNIPLYVKSFEKPLDSGTRIAKEDLFSYPPMVIVEKDLIMINISKTDFTFIEEDDIAFIFSTLDKYRAKVKFMRNGAMQFTLCIKSPKERFNNCIKHLTKKYNVKDESAIDLITIRYFNEHIIENLKKERFVISEERLNNTAQLVTIKSPSLVWKN